MSEEVDPWKSFNDHYRNYPPQVIFDDTGIRHQNEVILPAKYEKMACECGKVHDIADGSWYHHYMKFFEDANVPHCIKIVKRCKECHKILMLQLIK